MKAILIIPLWCSFLAISQAKPPIFLSYQDSIGQYSFGYSDPMSARSEYRASDGIIRGAYSYIDNYGLIQTAEYEAGKDLGFRIRASNLPEAPMPVMDTPEVREAKDRHLKLLIAAQMRDGRSKMPMAESKSAGTIEENFPMIHSRHHFFKTLHEAMELPSTGNTPNAPMEQPIHLGMTMKKIVTPPQIVEANMKKMSAAEKMGKPVEMTKNAEGLQFGTGITSSDASLGVMDTRLPALNEFQQTKLKAGYYTTPIEISHISPTNVLPTLYPQFLGSEAVKYVYL